MNNKCSCKVLVKLNKGKASRYRNCKSKTFININNMSYCWSHCNQYYKTAAIKIQSTFKSFYYRKKINNLYKNLPEDVQSIICHYLRKDFYYNKYKNKVHEIINNKLNTLDLFIKSFVNPQTGLLNSALLFFVIQS